jgi:hypothetical protein
MRCFEPVNFNSGGLGVVAMIIALYMWTVER